MRSATASTSPASTMYCDSQSAIISGIPPTREAMTGTPQASDSMTERGRASCNRPGTPHHQYVSGLDKGRPSLRLGSKVMGSPTPSSRSSSSYRAKSLGSTSERR